MMLFGYGIYVVYLHIRMKNTGEIPKTLISNKINLNNSKNIPGYIEYTFYKGIAFGILVSVCSAIMYFRNLLPGIVSLVAEIVFFVALIVNSIILVKAQQKYLL